MSLQHEVHRLDQAGKPVDTTTDESEIRYGRNGVPVVARPSRTRGDGYRTYEVFQRQRVGESTEKIKPHHLVSEAFLLDPYPTLAILRENYPCYRDWIGNSYWISRYDDVTSVFADEANFETRSKLWFYGMEGFGRNLCEELPVLTAFAQRIDANARGVAEAILEPLVSKGSANLAVEFAARYPLELLARAIDLPAADFPNFVDLYWRMQRGAGWNPRLHEDGIQALEQLTAYIRPILEQRRRAPGDDVISAIAALDLPDGPATAEDVVTTLLERDHQTLHGALANLWYLLLSHPDQLEYVTRERRMVKFAYLETLRHSAPVLDAKRFARHEVERFGRLLPEGAMVVCSAAAANRDPRVYADPDRFIVGRKDLCQREPRGQYRADGLPAAVAVGLGKPSKHPAIPEDRPRSLYAITRDTAVTASQAVLDLLPRLRLQQGARPVVRCLAVGEMHACWHLPVEFDRA
jgi:cytochrome P450